MAKIDGRSNIELRVCISLSEDEARALDALVGYGDDSFVKAFYEKLGKHYMTPHEQGLRSLFKSCRDFLPGLLKRVDESRKIFLGTCENTDG